MPIKRTLGILLVLLSVVYTNSAQVTADFTYSDSVGCSFLQVSFCDNSSSTAGNIVGWSWDLGGVSNSRECPSRIFGTTGNYTICLTATDDQGNTATVCKRELIQVKRPPVAQFDASPKTGCVPLEVTFTDQSSAPDGNITDWLWGLGGSCGTVVGDGSTPAAKCTYDIPDKYSISLTVTDDNGCTHSVTKNDFIEASPVPEIVVGATDTFSCVPPHSVTFTNTSPASNIDFAWDFGNGEISNSANPPAVTYTNYGNFTVTVTATNRNTGCVSTKVMTNLVEIGNTTEFTVSADSVCEGESVTFTNITLAAADSLLWDFGNGANSRDANPTYVYNRDGCYTVTLTHYKDGCASTFTYPNCIKVNPAPDASYNNNNGLGCQLPHVVNFAGIPQSPNIDSWFWEFGDGTTSSDQNPTHSYNEYGTFIVTLTVTDANNCSYSISNSPIIVLELEGAIVDQNISGCAPLDFTLQESSNSVAPIDQWFWSIQTQNNLFTSSDQSPSFTIPDTGSFDVTLIVRNSLGCFDTITVADMVQVGALPTIDFVASTLEECIEVPIDFTNLSSSFATTWLWEFGDGEESVAKDAVHEFQDTGFYDITLSGSHYGCTNFLTKPDYLHIKEPLAKFDVVQSCDDVYRVEFVDRSVGAETVEWDFGVAGVTTDTSTERSPVFVFPAFGEYTVMQTAFNSTTNCQHSTTVTITIADPSAQFSFSTQAGCAPLVVSTSDQSAWAVEWNWTAPGGTISNFAAPAPNITYDTPGAYTNVQLIVTDINGCRDTFINTDTIFVNGINVDFVADPLEGCNPQQINLTDASSNLFGNNIQWDWQFSGGGGSATGGNATHTLSGEGKYDLTLVIRDDLGCSGTLTKKEYIDINRPVAAFSAEDTLSCTQHCVTFDNQSIGNGLQYVWDFGDGNTSFDQFPSHCYAADGTYTICLTVTDLRGCDSTLCLTDYIVIADPVAAFVADSTFASCPPLPINFVNNSQNAFTYQWDFGDGSGRSNTENPTHVYTIPGSYEITLIATSIPECSDTLRLDNFAVLDGPQGSFSYEVDSSCVPVKVTFFGESVSDYFYVWNYGNGLADTSATTTRRDTHVYYYTEEGTFFPALSIIDGRGCENILIDQGTGITTSIMDLDFVASDTVLCDNNETIQFTNFSFSNRAMSFEWIFEDGNPANSTNPEESVVFPNVGGFDVTLIGDNGLCKDTLVRNDYIRIGPVPIAAFRSDLQSGCEPLDVQFTDESVVSSGFINNWNWDFGDGDSSIEQSPLHTFADGNNIPITLTVETELGCRDSTSRLITVLAQTDVSAGDDITICLNEVTRLQGEIGADTSDVDFMWSPSAGLSCTDCLDPLASPLDTTTYTLTVTNSNGCVSSSSITVNVRPFAVPVISISDDTTICAREYVQLFVSGGDDISSYQWDDGRAGLNCYASCLNPIANPAQTTTYIVTVTNQFGCSSMDSVTVNVVDEFMSFAGEDRTICRDDTAQIRTDFGSSPQWMVNNGLDCTFCANPVASPDSTTTYVVRVTTDRGCLVTDSITIEIIQPASVDAGEDFTVCQGGELSMQAIGDGNISWSPATGLSDPNILNPQVRPPSETMYYLTVQNGDCILTDSVVVTPTEKTEITFEDQVICQGDSLFLEYTGVADNFSWMQIDGIRDLTAANPLVNPDTTTTFQVVASFMGCQPDTAFAYVEVIPAPILNVFPLRYYMPGQSLVLNRSDDQYDDYLYMWTSNSVIDCDTCAQPAITPDSSDYYTVLVEDLLTGCTNEATVYVELLDYCPDELIGAPNIFTPNDDGFNDEFLIYPSSAIPEVTSIRIFDRWGAIVFEGDDQFASWDGTANGQLMPNGVYVYVVEAPCIATGGTMIKTGSLTLIR